MALCKNCNTEILMMGSTWHHAKKTGCKSPQPSMIGGFFGRLTAFFNTKKK